MATKPLSTHPLLRTAIERNQPLVERAGRDLIGRAEQGKKLRAEESPRLSPTQMYDLEVFRRIGNVLLTVERLRDATMHMLTFPEAKRYEKKGIDRNRWFDYHYAVYVITQSSFLDLSLVLTNSV